MKLFKFLTADCRFLSEPMTGFLLSGWNKRFCLNGLTMGLWTDGTRSEEWGFRLFSRQHGSEFARGKFTWLFGEVQETFDKVSYRSVREDMRRVEQKVKSRYKPWSWRSV